MSINIKNESNNSSPHFVAIDIKRLNSARHELNCNIYIKLTDSKMTKVFSIETGLDFKRLKQYMRKGVNEVFVKKEEYDKFTKFISLSPVDIIVDFEKSDAEKSAAILAMADQNYNNIFSMLEVNPEAAEKTKVVVNSFIKTFNSDPKLLASLLRSIKHDNELFYHAMSTSIISLFIANKAKQDNQKIYAICGIGGFLHDIGLSQIPNEIINNLHALTAAQMKEYRRHPKLGLRMLENCRPISDEIRLVVMQHHEEPGGGGFPNGIRGMKIYYPAKIVSIADFLCEMISKAHKPMPCSVLQAMSHMKENSEKFDRELLAITLEIFAPSLK